MRCWVLSSPCGSTAGQGRPDGVHRRPRPPRLNPIREFPLFVTPVLLLPLLPWKLGVHDFIRCYETTAAGTRVDSPAQKPPQGTLSPILNKLWFARKFVWNYLILIAIWNKSLQPHSCQRGFVKVLCSGWAAVAEGWVFTPLVWIMSVIHTILLSVYLEHWEISLIVGKLTYGDKVENDKKKKKKNSPCVERMIGH